MPRGTRGADAPRSGGLFVAALALLVLTSPARAYVEAPLPLGAVVQQSVVVCSMVVTKVDRGQNLIVYQKVADLKGKHPQDVIKHNIGRGGLRAGEWEEIMKWAEVGKPAVFFHNGSASETFIGPTWYQAYPQGEWWGMSHGEPFLLRSYAGKVDKLSGLVRDIVAGKEVVVPCMLDGDKEALHKKTAKVQRMKVSLKLQDYDPKRDFAGWGGEDIRRLAGMPGFDRLAPVGRADADARSATAIDFDGDGKPGLCLCGANKVLLLQNGGDSFTEVSLPGLATGASAAVWADHNGDGRPDLLLATPRGPKLFTNLGKGQFRDDTRLLPQEPAYHPTAAAWGDFDGDGKPDLVLANGFYGVRLYRNNRPADVARLAPPALGPWHAVGPFRDTSGKGNHIFAFAPEKDADLAKKHKGKRDVLVAWEKKDYKDGANVDLRPFGGNCAVYLQREVVASAAVEVPAAFGSGGPLTVWLNGEKLHEFDGNRKCAPDQSPVTLRLKPGRNTLLVKVCTGADEFAVHFAASDPATPGGYFADATAAAGLAGLGRVDSLVAADFTGDGKPDLLIDGRLFVNDGAGRFTPAGAVPLDPRAGVAVGDFDGDGLPDLLVPSPRGVKLFRNTGGQFEDVTAKSGDLATFTGHAAGAAWGDFDGDGKPDLALAVLRGPTRVYRNLGNGAFQDVSAALGLTTKVFNAQAAAWADVNADGRLDLVLANEGQDSAVLFGATAPPAGRTPVSVAGAVGGVQVLDAAGKVVASSTPASGDGRGGQTGTAPRFTLAPGAYTLLTTGPDGQPRSQALAVGAEPVAVRAGP